MDFEIAKRPNVILSIRETGVAVLELNRPLKRNALSQDLIDELTRALQQLGQDPNVRSVILTSVGQSPFSGE
jgi:enoyl-CoA hydratase